MRSADILLHRNLKSPPGHVRAIWKAPGPINPELIDKLTSVEWTSFFTLDQTAYIILSSTNCLTSPGSGSQVTSPNGKQKPLFRPRNTQGNTVPPSVPLTHNTNTEGKERTLSVPPCLHVRVCVFFSLQECVCVCVCVCVCACSWEVQGKVQGNPTNPIYAL